MEFLNEYINIIVLAFCLGLGYIIKNSLDFIPNKYIPLIMGIVGIIANVINVGFDNITLSTVTTGLITGLASTGAFELVKELLTKEDKEKEE